MPQQITYASDDQTPLMTADAFGVRLRQSGFAVLSQVASGDDVDLVLDGVVLRLFVESGFVVEIDCQVTLVNDRRSARLLELIESMGWALVEE
jgi:hypothetical protein